MELHERIALEDKRDLNQLNDQRRKLWIDVYIKSVGSCATTSPAYKATTALENFDKQFNIEKTIPNRN